MKSVIGIIIGEGCFQMALYERKRNRFGIQPRPQFTVDLHIDDKDTLYSVKNKTNIGSVYEYPNSNLVRWETTSVSSCDKIEELIRDNSGDIWETSAKSDSFEKWRKLREDKNTLMKTKSGMKELIHRASEINDFGSGKKDWISIVENN